MDSKAISVTPETVREIVAEMGALDLPVSAKTYHVWFGHRLGWYPDLSHEIDRASTRGARVDGPFCETLYTKYISMDRRTHAMHEAESAVRSLIKTVLRDVRDSTGATSEFRVELDRFVDRLGEAADVRDVSAIVRGLIDQTHKMESMRAELTQHIERANADIGKLKRELTELERETTTDALTGLHNRKALNRHVALCFEAFKSSGAPFCVIMLDVDHFKLFNDRYGHDVGDAVLRSVSMTLADTGHPSATPHRYGGEEFCVLVGECALADGVEFAESIRTRIEGRRLKIARTDERIKPIAISIGVAEANKRDTPDSLIQRADAALYLAKETGRNNVKSERDLNAKSPTK